MRPIGHWAAGLGVAGTLLFAATESRAGQPTCGTTNAGWNVPAGDPVLVSGPGPIYAVLSAVGEYRSHSMLSNGPDGWVTHATAVTPPTNSDMSPYLTPFCSSCGSECWNPIDPGSLYNAMPGLETISQGAAYEFLYSGSSTSGGSLSNATINANQAAGPGESYVAYQRGNTAANQAAVNNISFGGTGMAWNGWWSGSNEGVSGDGGQYVWGHTYNGAQVHYGWYQYMNDQSVAQGVPGVNTGVVCSSSLALWQHDAGGLGDVLSRSYGNPRGGTALLSNAGNALWNGVQSECNASTGWFANVGSFFLNLGWNILCVGVSNLSEGVCGQAADQMVNCFANNNCGNKSSPGAYGSQKAWQSTLSSATLSAIGISPDDIGGWNHPANGSGAPDSGGGSSIWGWDSGQTVQWNSGGNSYACWD